MLAHSLTVSDGFGLCFGRSKFSFRDFRDYPETSATYQCLSRNYEISELPLRPGEQWREVVLGNRTAMLKQQHSMMDVHRSPLCPPVSKPLRSSPG